MGFLRRILGGGRDEGADEPTPTPNAVDEAADERRHELDVLREEAERMDDLARRQLKYADRAWQPPAQGGERRSDDPS